MNHLLSAAATYRATTKAAMELIDDQSAMLNLLVTLPGGDISASTRTELSAIAAKTKGIKILNEIAEQTAIDHVIASDLGGSQNNEKVLRDLSYSTLTNLEKNVTDQLKRKDRPTPKTPPKPMMTRKLAKEDEVKIEKFLEADRLDPNRNPLKPSRAERRGKTKVTRQAILVGFPFSS